MDMPSGSEEQKTSRGGIQQACIGQKPIFEEIKASLGEQHTSEPP